MGRGMFEHWGYCRYRQGTCTICLRGWFPSDRVFGICAAVTGHVESAEEVKISVTMSHKGDISEATGSLMYRHVNDSIGLCSSPRALRDQAHFVLSQVSALAFLDPPPHTVHSRICLVEADRAVLSLGVRVALVGVLVHQS